MSETHLDIYPENKQELYALLAEQLTALTDGEPHAIPNLANCAALLFYALKNINWAGFYLTQTDAATGKDYLLLGPFQGKTACDSASNSEIVLPIRKNGKIVGVLDIDSPVLARFDKEDREGLQRLVEILEKTVEYAVFPCSTVF